MRGGRTSEGHAPEIVMGMLTTVIGTVFVLGGLGLLSYLSLGFWLGVSSLRWPTVEGEVLSSRVEVDSTSDAVGLSYRPKVRYRYAVHGRNYVSESFTYKGHSTEQEAAEEMAGRYRRGSLVKVHYHPRRPKWAVLEPGTTLTQYIIAVIFSTGMLTLGIALLLGIVKPPSG